MNKQGKNMGYFQLKTAESRVHPRKEQPFYKTTEIHPNVQNSFSNCHNHQPLYAQIDQAAQTLRAKTISLVCQLRRNCLHEQLEMQIQSYLTNVLDQMDLLVAKKESAQEIQSAKSDKDSTSTFEQIPKPTGDDQYFHVEQTVRQPIRLPLQTIHELSKQATQVELSSKLQSILSELESNNDNSYSITNNQKAKMPIYVTDGHHDQENRPKGSEQKAHRFSNLYIRDINKGKRNRLF